MTDVTDTTKLENDLPKMRLSFVRREREKNNFYHDRNSYLLFMFTQVDDSFETENSALAKLASFPYATLTHMASENAFTLEASLPPQASNHECQAVEWTVGFPASPFTQNHNRALIQQALMDGGLH